LTVSPTIYIGLYGTDGILESALRLLKVRNLKYGDKIDPHEPLFEDWELTWHYVILNNELATVQYGQRQAVRTVFQTMIKAAQHDQTWNLFPPAYQDELYAAQSDTLLKKRIVVHYVATMTEHDLARIYAVLTGIMHI
jgi:dGTP triphosphohydrolase